MSEKITSFDRSAAFLEVVPLVWIMHTFGRIRPFYQNTAVPYL